jgi:hypothetical protein
MSGVKASTGSVTCIFFGSPLTSTKSPSTHNGTESVTMSKKNVRGDLLRDAVVFEESSPAGRGKGGICGSCFEPLPR